MTRVGSAASYGWPNLYPMVELPRWGTVIVSALLMDPPSWGSCAGQVDRRSGRPVIVSSPGTRVNRLPRRPGTAVSCAAASRSGNGAGADGADVLVPVAHGRDLHRLATLGCLDDAVVAEVHGHVVDGGGVARVGRVEHEVAGLQVGHLRGCGVLVGGDPRQLDAALGVGVTGQPGAVEADHPRVGTEALARPGE